MKYEEARAYLDQIKAYGMSPGLEGIRRLCGRLGDPQQALRFVHIAGTNGKGSVSAYLDAALRKGGYRVGRFSSPAVFDERESIQADGRPIPKAAVCRYAERLRAVCGEIVAEGLPHPTAFEMETAMGFLYFQEKHCDIVVLEAGMGGLLDATNIAERTEAAVLTSVSRDHMAFLGETLAGIAVQKAGILKRGCHVVTLGQAPEVMEVIAGRAAGLGCPLTVVDRGKISHVHYGLERQRFDYGERRRLEISLAGPWQIENAALAVAALDALAQRGFPLREESLRAGLLEAQWQGRFTVVGRKPYFILDGAHNEDAARRLAEALALYFSGRRTFYIMGMLRDKEYEKVIGLTHALAEQIVTVSAPGNPRALSAYELAQAAAKVHPRVTAADSLEEAAEMCRLLADREDVIVAFGSLSFLGALKKIIDRK